MQFRTGAGIIAATVDDDIVESQLTTPKVLRPLFEEMGRQWWLIDTGVPHLVTVSDDPEAFDPLLARQMRQLHNANVNFARLEGETLYVRTYERGVEAETLACGTGMAAAFFRLFQEKCIPGSATVIPTGGEAVTVSHKDGRLFLKGAVRQTFHATPSHLLWERA